MSSDSSKAGGIDWAATEIREDEETITSLRGLKIGSYGFLYEEDGIYIPLFDGADYFRVPMAAALRGKELCISGSRDFNDWELVRLAVKSLPVDVALITGGARGVDREAYLAGQEFRLNQAVYPADWDKLGKSAGIIRNIEMIDNCSDVIAFWDGKSPGTKHAVTYANEQGKLLFVFPPRPQWQEYNDQRGTEQAVEKWGTPALMSVARDLEDA